MKQITPQEIEQIMTEILSLNIPVQSFIKIEQIFKKLEAVPNPDEKK